MLDKVVPNIIDQWPRQSWNNPRCIIWIQQDGPNLHLPEGELESEDDLARLGVENKILLYTQPPNSPDVNINDLGFFRALDAAYQHEEKANEGEIIHFVEKAYDDFDHNKINRIWLTLMTVLNGIISHGGGNNFKIPHLGKERLDRQNCLPTVLPVTEAAREFLCLGVDSDEES